MMFLMKLPLQTGYTILSEGWSCPTMPNDDEDDFVLDSSRRARAVIRLIEALGQSSTWPVVDDNAEGPLADDSAEGPVAGGAARPVAGAADEDASAVGG